MKMAVRKFFVGNKSAKIGRLQHQISQSTVTGGEILLKKDEKSNQGDN